jgi:sortase A
MIAMRQLRPSRARQRCAAAFLVVALVAGCTSSDDDTVSSLPATTSITTPPEDSTPDTSRPRSTRRSPRRTTTTLPTLGVPIPPPPENTVEPEVILGSIEIPAIGVSETMYSGITLPTLDRGPGHWPGSAMPGDWGNTVVAGHRVSGSRPFHDLDRLVAGDEIVFTTDQGRFVYAVTNTEIVEPNALWITDQTYEHRATLFACHPPGSVRYRIAVFADLVDPST